VLLVALGYPAHRAILLLARGGVLVFLHQLPSNVGLSPFFLRAAAGLRPLLTRIVRRIR
jgi:hypothetical protein